MGIKLKIFLGLIFWMGGVTCASLAMAQNTNTSTPIIKIIKTPRLGLPIDCAIGEDCWVMNYVDLGPDDGKQTDHACLERTYDGHKGTDFAIADGLAMEQGVNVLATSDGVIKKVRDGEFDRWPTEEELTAAQEQRKECGNAVLIDHSEGFQTLYCHLKNGSLRVKPQDQVKQGDVIGQVGLSGYTRFPHLHFGVLKNGKILDPFTGLANSDECNKTKQRIWQKEIVLDYQPLTIQGLGFSNTAPKLHDIEKSSNFNNSITINSEVLTFWTMLFGVQKNDKISIDIKDPNDKTYIKREITQDTTRARQFYYTGHKTRSRPLMEGAYTGTVRIVRESDDGRAPQEWIKTKAVLVKP